MITRFRFDSTNVQVTIQVMKKYPERLKELPLIRVVLIEEHHWSLDNRRLYVHLSCAPLTPLLCILEPHFPDILEELRVKKKNRTGDVPQIGHY
jgi:hypothetical protein